MTSKCVIHLRGNCQSALIFRSCVPKVGEIKLDCSSATGNLLALCYCHEDYCNKGTRYVYSSLLQKFHYCILCARNFRIGSVHFATVMATGLSLAIAGFVFSPK